MPAALPSQPVTRLRSLFLAAGLLLTVPGAAQGATLDAGRSCYPVGDEATLTGSGFAPESQIKFSVNGTPLRASIMSDAAGDIRVAYRPPRVKTERRLVIRATDSEETSARTTIYVTRRLRVTADPDSSTNVSTWRAVFRLFGFGRGKAYIHYVNPKGRHERTVRLGRLVKPCGRLKTAKRRMMPFENPQPGYWKLQFDTRRRYSRNTARKRVIPVRVYRG
jgi:hypothetical protein